MKEALLIKSADADGCCELCGKEDELRPYGPNGEKICFECGVKDEETTSEQFAKAIDGKDVVVLDARRSTHD